MTALQDLPAPVQWFEGMLLAPQHFQQQSLRQEELLHYHLARLAPHHFGVHLLKHDPPLLHDGVLRIVELEAVMPDGLVVSQRPDDLEPLDLDLRPHLKTLKQGPLRIYLTVPADKRSGAQAEGELSRYTSTSSPPRVDENTGDNALPIAELRPRLRLTVGAPPPRFCALPLLDVGLEGESFTLGDYIGPQLAVQPSTALGELAARVARRIREKAAYLMDVIRAPATTTDPALIEENRGLIHHLVSGLSAYEAVLRTGTSHPFTVYTALCGLAGSVATVGFSLVPPVFATYDHRQLRRCYDEVAEFILRSLDEGISEAFTRVPLRLEREVFSTRFRGEWLKRELVLGVLGQPGTTEKQILQWMASCRIGAESKLPSMRDMRVLGARRQAIDRREGLVARRGTFLFSLDPDARFVVPNELLVLENAGEPSTVLRPAEITLYVRTQG